MRSPAFGPGGVAPLLPVTSRANKGKRSRGTSLVQVIVVLSVLLCAGYGLFAFSFLERAAQEGENKSRHIPRGEGAPARVLQEAARGSAQHSNLKVADPNSPGVIYRSDSQQPGGDRPKVVEHRTKGSVKAPVIDSRLQAKGGETESQSGKGPDVYAPQVLIESTSQDSTDIHAPDLNAPVLTHHRTGNVKAPVLDSRLQAKGGETESQSGKAPDVYAPQVLVESTSQDSSEVHAPVLTRSTLQQQQHQATEAGDKRLPAATGLYALKAVDINGVERSLSEYAGKVVLVVNVASACGYTDSNYKGLMKTWEKYHPFGFDVLGFPCNQFGQQESGTESEISSFCTSKYHVKFPMFSKVEVNGHNAHPVFKFLKRELPASEGGGGGQGEGRDLTWNFNKFLVNKHGYPEKFFYQDYDIAAVEHEVYRMMSASD